MGTAGTIIIPRRRASRRFPDKVAYVPGIAASDHHSETRAIEKETIRKDCLHPQGIHQELAKTIQNVALVCVELLGLSDEELAKQFPDFEPPCGKKGTSIKDQIDAIIDIQAGWMTTGIKKALEKYWANPDPEDKWTKAKWDKK